MRNVLAIVGTIALSTAAYAQNDPQVINPRALFPKVPLCLMENSSTPNTLVKQ